MGERERVGGRERDGERKRSQLKSRAEPGFKPWPRGWVQESQWVLHQRHSPHFIYCYFIYNLLKISFLNLVNGIGNGRMNLFILFANFVIP